MLVRVIVSMVIVLDCQFRIGTSIRSNVVFFIVIVELTTTLNRYVLFELVSLSELKLQFSMVIVEDSAVIIVEVVDGEKYSNVDISMTESATASIK